jgi:uncharacterized membrane protein YcaP (DUF421 family)
MDIIKVILTALLSVVALFIVTKLMGHKQVAQLDFFDYVCGITIGSIGAELATELERPYIPLIALSVWGGASLLLNLMTSKMPSTRKYINGAPTIVMSDGRLIRSNLKKARLDLSEFMLLCREQGYLDLDEIQVAVFEHNGQLSILPRAQNRPLTPEDVGIAKNESRIGTELIMDGRIIGENLTRLGRDATWLKNRLNSEGVYDTKAIFLAVYREDTDKLTLYLNE